MEDTNWDLDWVYSNDSISFGVGGSGWDSATSWNRRVEMGGSSCAESYESAYVQIQQRALRCGQAHAKREGIIKK